mgnify:CR=1 FL=1
MRKDMRSHIIFLPESDIGSNYAKKRRFLTKKFFNALDCTVLSSDRMSITFTDKFGAGSFKLWGTRDLHFYQISNILGYGTA